MARAHFVDIETGENGLVRLLEDRNNYRRWELLVANPVKVSDAKEKGQKFEWLVQNRVSYAKLTEDGVNSRLVGFLGEYSVPRDNIRLVLEKLQISIWDTYRYGEVVSFGNNPRVTLKYEDPGIDNYTPKEPHLI